MRCWRLPPRCLDDKRLNGQHNEIHIMITCARKVVEGEPATGWASANNAQLKQWIGKRGALYRYHNDIVLPECRRRFPKSVKYHDHQLFDLSDLPESERDHPFWLNVTWDQVLLDVRHLIEKHNNDKAMIRLCQEHRQPTRVVMPKGHDPIWILGVFYRAIHHVYQVPLADTESLQRIAMRLTRQKLLDPPQLKIAA